MQFVYLLTFICNSQIYMRVTFVVICGHAQWQMTESPDMPILAEVKQEDTLLFLFRLSCCILSMVHLVPHFLHLCLFLVISLFKMAPKHIAEMLSSVAKCKKAVMCLVGKITCIR